MNKSAKALIVALSALSAVATVNAQDIRIIAPKFQSGRIVGLYEVIDGSRTGGAFVNRRYTVNGFTFDGYTDRVSRGEMVGTVVFGRGNLQQLGIKANGNVIGIRYNVPMPFFQVNFVSMSPSFSNVNIFARFNNVNYVKHLPIGTR